MNLAKLFEDGARLPEELSRLIFLEPVIAGRRVLEVGARSPAVARFLLELGAARVVSASEDREVVTALRAEHAAYVEEQRANAPTGGLPANAERYAERIDVRVIRPGMLPGDDGAFDLVIDFDLPTALAEGKTFRLTDIGRLLSADGFAITALSSGTTPGLSALFSSGESTAGTEAGDGETVNPTSEAAQPRSAVSPATPPSGAAINYRSTIEALRLQFELVQVYFQSLMLGYFFGSYDVDPKDDGIAPHTALMGGEPEPAGHYIFAFGNAVPVVEDVALVQVPCADLFTSIGRARHGLHLTVEPREAPAGETEASMDLVAGQLERASDQRHEFDESVRKSAELVADAARAFTENAILREERSQLLTYVERIEQAIGDHELRGRLLEETCEQQREHIAELEAAMAHVNEEPNSLHPHSLHPHGAHEAMFEELRDQLALYERELAAAADALAEEHERHDALFAEVERLRDVALRAEDLEGELERVRLEQAAHNADHAADAQRRAELEADAVRLAEAVKSLVDEREKVRQRLAEAEARAEEAVAEAERFRAAHDAVSEQVTAFEVKDEARDRRLKSAHAGRDEARRDADVARAALADVAGQRDTLKHVVASREREIAALKDDIHKATSEVQRLNGQVEAQDKALAEARHRLANFEVERTQLKRRMEELGRSQIEAAARAEALERQLAGSREGEHVDDGLRHDLVRSAAQTAVLEASLAEARGALLVQSARGELLGAQLAEAQETLTRLQARGDLLSAELAELRQVAERERARADLAAATLDEMREAGDSARAQAELTMSVLGEVRERMARESVRADGNAERLNASVPDILHTRSGIEGGKSDASSSPSESSVLNALTEVETLKRRVMELEQAGVEKDTKLQEQAERIHKLTERLVREAGLS